MNLTSMVENGLEKSISFAIERGSIISDGDKPVKTIMELSAISNWKAIHKLREKKKRPDISTITNFIRKTKNHVPVI